MHEDIDTVETGFHNASAAWLSWSAVYLSSLALAFLFFPALLANGAYRLAEDLFPFWVWGALCIWGAASAVAARVLAHHRAAIVSQAILAWTTFLYGLSILALTLEGSLAAFVGSVTWWTHTVVATWFLRKGF